MWMFIIQNFYILVGLMIFIVLITPIIGIGELLMGKEELK